MNRPFSSCFEPHYESEAMCKVLLWKSVFIHMQTKLIFIRKALHLVSLSYCDSFLVFNTRDPSLTYFRSRRAGGWRCCYRWLCRRHCKRRTDSLYHHALRIRVNQNALCACTAISLTLSIIEIQDFAIVNWNSAISSLIRVLWLLPSPRFYLTDYLFAICCFSSKTCDPKSRLWSPRVATQITVDIVAQIIIRGPSWLGCVSSKIYWRTLGPFRYCIFGLKLATRLGTFFGLQISWWTFLDGKILARSRIRAQCKEKWTFSGHFLGCWMCFWV